jgi:hypothetical protein
MTLATPPPNYVLIPEGKEYPSKEYPLQMEKSNIVLKEILFSYIPPDRLGPDSLDSNGKIAVPTDYVKTADRFAELNTGKEPISKITIKDKVSYLGMWYDSNNTEFNPNPVAELKDAFRAKTEGRVASKAELDALQPDQIIMNGRIVNMPDTTPLSSPPLTLDLTGRGAEIGTIQETFNVTGTMGGDAAAAIDKPGTQGLFPKGSLEMNDLTLVPMDQEVIKQHLGQMSTSGTESSAFSKMPAGFTVGQVAKTDLDLGPGNDVIKLGEQVNGTTATQTSALPPPVIVDALKPAPPVDANGKYIESKSPAAPPAPAETPNPTPIAKPTILRNDIPDEPWTWTDRKAAEEFEMGESSGPPLVTTTTPKVTPIPAPSGKENLTDKNLIKETLGRMLDISTNKSLPANDDVKYPIGVSPGEIWDEPQPSTLKTAAVEGNYVALPGIDKSSNDALTRVPGYSNSYQASWRELAVNGELRLADGSKATVDYSGNLIRTGQKPIKAEEAVRNGIAYIEVGGQRYGLESSITPSTTATAPLDTSPKIVGVSIPVTDAAIRETIRDPNTVNLSPAKIEKYTAPSEKIGPYGETTREELEKLKRGNK